MKKGLFSLLFIAHSLSAHAEEGSYETGAAAGFASHDTTVLSVLGWGLILAAAIVTICLMVPTDKNLSS